MEGKKQENTKLISSCEVISFSVDMSMASYAKRSIYFFRMSVPPFTSCHDS